METTNKTYFEWLYSLIEPSNPDKKSYKLLMTDLHQMEYISLVPNDDNRAKDGEDLRVQFVELFESAANPLTDVPCTVFEMLIALAFRMHEIMLDEPFELSVSDCFWVFIKNLDLDWYDDLNNYHLYGEGIEINVRAFLDRRYNYNGHRGLFPLKRAKRDQRKTEVWYQMSDYLLEKYQF